MIKNSDAKCTYQACRSKRNSQLGTAEAGEPAEYRGASESAAMSSVEETTGVESMPLSE
jgi:hypothetical protein